MSTNSISLILFSIFIALPQMLFAIITIHHDKPEGSHIAQMVNKMKYNNRQQYFVPFNLTKLNNERQKRLLPYINYYTNNKQNRLNHQNYELFNLQQQPNNHRFTEYQNNNGKFTPFLESNAIPGPFIPIIKTTENHNYLEDTEQNIIKNQPTIIQQTIPNYSMIYDKLTQLKLNQQQINRFTIPPIIQQKNNYVPIYKYDNQRYKILPSSTTQSPLIKTIIHTYTPTQIDLTTTTTNNNHNNQQNNYKNNQNYKENVIYDIYQPEQYLTINTPRYNQRFGDKFKKPVIFFDEKPIISVRPKIKPQVIVENNYVAQKYIPVTTPIIPQQQYEEVYYQTSPSTPILQPKDDQNTLSKILKQLQDANALPHTLTPENIDNSIRTLVKILNNLKLQRSKFSKPIIVHDDNDYNDGGIYGNIKEDIHNTNNNNNNNNNNNGNDDSGTTIQNFPANTIDGGTPGRPGIDYPALSTIPQTDFNCKTQRYKGFFGDPNTNCQVWHYCDLNGGQASFLCPNGTIFSQVALTCDWWYNVKCSSTPQLYVLNERLYKYILPLSPKFPEDYSGPLVDKYLALKFQEMEEKMEKERKGKKPKQDNDQDEQNSNEEKDDSDQLREIQAAKDKEI